MGKNVLPFKSNSEYITYLYNVEETKGTFFSRTICFVKLMLAPL